MNPDDIDVLEDQVPPSFANLGHKGFLGNSELVHTLVAQFCVTFEELCAQRAAKKLTPEEYVEKCEALTRKYAAIFSNKDPDYLGIEGYHGGTLPYKLMGDLREFWRTARDRWNDDAMCVFFEWLALMLLEAQNQSKGDEMIKAGLFGPNMSYAVQVLLGIEERQR